MKKFIFPIAFLLLALNLFSDSGQNEETITNVAVPVRVSDGTRFVDNINLEDFELYENGILQKIDALYFIKKTTIERKEALKEFNPQLSRDFYFLFQVTDWDSKLAEAIDDFFSNVFLPGDTLVMMTPERSFRLSPEVFRSRTKEQTVKEMVKKLRKDINLGSSRYKSTLRSLKRLVSEMQGATGFSTGARDSSVESLFGQDSSQTLELLLPRYQDAIQRLDELRVVDEKTFLKFAAALRDVPNQKNVFLFYQREFRPEINPSVLGEMMMKFQDKPHILGKVSELFDLYKREIRIDPNRIKAAFADSSILFNLIFSHKSPDRGTGIYMREQSEDIFKVFSEVAAATGGIVESSQNPSAGFKKAAEASESYYLLYYTPVNYMKDGKFRNIIIRVKGQNYKITNRLGYFAQ